MATQESGKGPDEVIHELGGCGRFQVRLALLIHVMNIVVAWSLYAMVFVTATPKWWCNDSGFSTNLSLNYNASEITDKIYEKSCVGQNGTSCSSFEFETSDMRTIVTEWNLVCDKAWIPALINSVQVGCQLFGNIFAGHLADYMGRKIPLFLSIVTMIVCNLLSYFSVSWLMYGISKALTGVGSGLWLTVRYNFMSEFTLARWRPWLISFPTWAIQGCILALVLWLLKDWRNTHLVIALVAIPFLRTWWLLPESFRWYYAHDRIDDAEKIINKVAKINRRPVPNMAYMKQLTMASIEENTKDRKYTALDLFKTRFLVKVTLLLFLNWFSMGIIGYGLNFGIQRLVGSIYLNIFLFHLVTIPSKFITLWLINRIGRRYTAIVLFIFTGVTALVVGIVQYIDTDKRDILTNTFAILANLGVSSVWGTIQTITVEIYPTVVRNIGFGICSTLSRIGAALAPQLVFMELYVPGVLYFCCGGVSIVCVLALIWLPETKDSNLSDKLKQRIQSENWSTEQ